ncbi:MAG TPA: hypothetical protein VF933_26700, partial [Streptosporangiaceae bacterium]
MLTTDWRVTGRDGVHFAAPRFSQPVTGVYVAHSFVTVRVHLREVDRAEPSGGVDERVHPVSRSLSGGS